jgi:hypothetical protein
MIAFRHIFALFSPPYFRLSRFAIIFATLIFADISAFISDCRHISVSPFQPFAELPPIATAADIHAFSFRYAAERRIFIFDVICFISARHSMIQHHHHRHVDHRLIA